MKRIYLGLLGLGICLVVTLVAYIFLIPNTESIDRYIAIPDKPNDFDAYTREIWKGGYNDLCDLPEEYWKRPEFFGTSWETSKKEYYDNPNYGMWGVYGQGNIPSKAGYTFENFKEGDEFELCTFFHNGFGVWTYQGFELLPIENEYFEVLTEPSELTVSPTFPVFEDGWVQKIRVKVRVKETPPIGSYQLGFDVATPSQKYSSEKNSEVLHMTINKEDYYTDCLKYLKDEERCNFLINNREKKYVAGGSYKTSQIPFQLGVTIK